MARLGGSIGGSGVRTGGSFGGASRGISGGSRGGSSFGGPERGGFRSGPSPRATFTQGEGILAAAQRAGFTSPPIGGFEGSRSAGSRLATGIGATRVAGLEGKIGPLKTISLPGNTGISEITHVTSINRSRLTNIRVIPSRPKENSGRNFIKGLGEFNPTAATVREGPVRTGRTLPQTRLFPINQPGRREAENGGRRGQISPNQLRVLLGQHTLSRRSEAISGTTDVIVQRAPEITDRPPIASPSRVEPGPGRVAPQIRDQQRPNRDTERNTDTVQSTSETKTSRNLNTNEQARRTTIRPYVVWSNGYPSEIAIPIVETGQKAPMTREVEQVLRDTSPKVALKSHSGISAEIKTAVQTARKEAGIKAELTEIGEKTLTRVQPYERITDSNVLPLRRPDFSRSPITVPASNEQIQASNTRTGILYGRANEAADYTAIMEDLQRKREKKESRKKKTLRLLLLERIRLLKQKLLVPAEDPANAPVRILQLKADTQVVAALDGRTNLLPNAAIQVGVSPDLQANVIPLKAKSNNQYSGSAPELPSFTSESKQNQQPAKDKEKLSLLRNMGQRKRIIFSVDQPVQEARVLAAAQVPVDNEGFVKGRDVAATLGNEKRSNLISSLLKALGVLGTESFVDGSLIKLQAVVGRIKRATKKDMNIIVRQQTESDPAVRMSADKSGRQVTEKEVRTVLNGVPLPMQEAA